MKFSVGVEPLVAQLLGTSICGNDLFIDACIEIYGQTYGTDHYNTDKVISTGSNFNLNISKQLYQDRNLKYSLDDLA